MEVIVGREQQSRRLAVVRDGKAQLVGQPGSVPMDVSRQHAAFSSLNKGKWEVRNLNPRNVTFVNGVAIEKKNITESDKVELGNTHYLISWDVIRGPKVETVDIRPLRRVWEDYNDSLIEIRKRQKNNGLLASVPMGFTMLGSVIGLFFKDNPEVLQGAIMFVILAFGTFIYGLFKRYSGNSIDEQEELKKDFQRRYTCPKCGHFMGNEPYDVLIQNEGCRYCKAKFVK
jgi:hypothetical protein